MLRPYPRYWYMVLARSLEAAATLIRSLLRSSYRRHCIPKLRSQNAQSAAPPAMVPKRYGLISMTFFTVCDAMYGPIVDRESTDTMMPSLNLKANVVVPFANCADCFES